MKDSFKSAGINENVDSKIKFLKILISTNQDLLCLKQYCRRNVFLMKLEIFFVWNDL